MRQIPDVGGVAGTIFQPVNVFKYEREQGRRGADHLASFVLTDDITQGSFSSFILLCLVGNQRLA
jgi:hypothetical protein